ncbi:MAG: hypothetical protein QOK37_4782 [Thermoanaerobaculia bacterium]|jgi:hypothetical protein|nr:hypothetical protein [Thermoanaerobaculia bacterium]
MSKSFRKSVVLCLFVGCLTTSAFGATRDTRDAGGFFAGIKRAIIHALDQIEIVWPKP